MKILITGIFLVCLNTFSGSTFDTITKYLSINNYKWYHYYSIGGTTAIISFLLLLFFTSGIKKNIFLEKKKYYFLPIFRGVSFIPVLIIIFYSLNYIPINIPSVIF